MCGLTDFKTDPKLLDVNGAEKARAVRTLLSSRCYDRILFGEGEYKALLCVIQSREGCSTQPTFTDPTKGMER